MPTVYSGFAAPRLRIGLCTAKAVGYNVVALEIDGLCQILLETVHLGLPHAIVGFRNGFVARKRLAAPAAAVCHSSCQRSGHHRRCRNLTVAEGQGLHSELAAGLHIVAEGRGHIYAGRSGGKTFW